MAADSSEEVEIAGGLRRVPKQERARRRIERILDTAEAVFVEAGYDNASTNQIAERAGTSIGSLYDFFPNKQAIAQALAERYIAQVGAVYDRSMVNDPESKGEQLIDAVVDALATLWQRHAGVVPLLRGALGAPELIEAGERLRVAFVERIDAVLADRRPDVPDGRRRQVAETDFDITRALLERVRAEPQHRRTAVLRELKTVLISYQRAALGMPADVAG